MPHLKNPWPAIFCLIIFSLSIAGSIWQGQYIIDHVHWGLMLGNAKDFVAGMVPYKDIYILYGFLTTLLHSLAYVLLGENLQSLIIFTSVAYAIGLLFIYFISNHILNSRGLSLCVLTSCFLFHPITIYPWSNYLAFPFLLSGLLLSIQSKSTARLFFSGALFGLAVLAREGLAPAVIAYIFANAIVDGLNSIKTRRQIIWHICSTLLGLLLPIFSFLLYLKIIDAISFWHDLSWQLPKIYAREFFPHMTGFKLIDPLFNQIFKGFARLDVRWILVGLIIMANVAVILIGLLNKKYRIQNHTNIQLAIFSLLLLSSSLHLPEVFRIATGSIVGLINVYALLRSLRIQKIGFLLIASLLLIDIAPADSGESFNTTNYFVPSKDILDQAKPVSSPSYFKNQKWDADAQFYYQSISKDLAHIAAKCDIQFHYNTTYDTFLQILSPFKKSQLAPFYLSDAMEALRPDLDWKLRTQPPSHLIIFKYIPTEQTEISDQPENFFIYKRYITPRTNFLYRKNSLLILVPNHCKDALNEN